MLPVFFSAILLIIRYFFLCSVDFLLFLCRQSKDCAVAYSESYMYQSPGQKEATVVVGYICYLFKPYFRAFWRVFLQKIVSCSSAMGNTLRLEIPTKLLYYIKKTEKSFVSSKLMPIFALKSKLLAMLNGVLNCTFFAHRHFGNVPNLLRMRRKKTLWG